MMFPLLPVLFGAGMGALMNKDDPLKGALLGAAGGGIGGGLLSMSGVPGGAASAGSTLGQATLTGAGGAELVLAPNMVANTLGQGGAALANSQIPMMGATASPMAASALPATAANQVATQAAIASNPSLGMFFEDRLMGAADKLSDPTNMARMGNMMSDDRAETSMPVASAPAPRLSPGGGDMPRAGGIPMSTQNALSLWGGF